TCAPCAPDHTHARAALLLVLFTRPPPPHIYTLSLHDALPISLRLHAEERDERPHLLLDRDEPRKRVELLEQLVERPRGLLAAERDRKSTRLNSSHDQISYAVFCLKKKKEQ